MFVSLILTVCLVSDPKDCHVEQYMFESHGSLNACMFEAVPYIAEWAGNHPNMKVARWHCEYPGASGEAL